MLCFEPSIDTRTFIESPLVTLLTYLLFNIKPYLLNLIKMNFLYIRDLRSVSLIKLNQCIFGCILLEDFKVNEFKGVDVSAF